MPLFAPANLQGYVGCVPILGGQDSSRMSGGAMKALCVALVMLGMTEGGMLLLLSYSKDKSRKDVMTLPLMLLG